MPEFSAKGLLLDLDGVVFEGEQAIPGAAEALQELKRRSLPFRFLTNNSTRSSVKLHSDMVALGLPIEPHEIINTPKAAAIYLKQFDKPKLHLVLSESARADFTQFDQSDTSPDFVVMGDIYDEWSYQLLDRVFNMIINGATLLALHKGRYWKTARGLQVDIGLFVAGLEYVTGKEAVVMGKPSATFFNQAVADIGIPKNELAMIGDDIENDIGGAQAAGIRGILVRTGKYRSDLVAQSTVEPYRTVASIESLAAVLWA